jgi:hypothetical protein
MGNEGCLTISRAPKSCSIVSSYPLYNAMVRRRRERIFREGRRGPKDPAERKAGHSEAP